MKSMIAVLVFMFLIAPIAPGQGKAVHFKKLQEFLPSLELKGLQRMKPTGQTQSSMGMSTSEAKVRYGEIPKTEEELAKEVQTDEVVQQRSIVITINDMAGIPYGQMTAMAYQQDFENETEDGYEKSVTIRNTYKGKESAKTGDYKSCDIEFMVGNRFQIKLEAEGISDPKILYSLIDSMNLAKLEKVTP